MTPHVKLAAVVAAVVIVVISVVGVTASSPSSEAQRVSTTTTPTHRKAAHPSRAALHRWEAALRKGARDRYLLTQLVHHDRLQVWNRAVLSNELARQHAVAQAREEAARAARAQAAQARTSVRSTRTHVPQGPSVGTGRCGGNLPPCCVMMRESGGNIHAQNPTSTASGKWQFVNGTWGGYGGYATAADAPESVQDARAAELWAGGAGAGHWGGGC